VAGLRVRFYSDTNLALFIDELEKAEAEYILANRASVVDFPSEPAPHLLQEARELGGTVEELPDA